MPDPSPAPIDWEAFYRDYRKPGYVQGYDILHKVGGGAFGVVYRARKQSIGKDYAIKFLKVDEEAVRDSIVRELRSVRFFAQVDHPNLVSIEDRGEVDGIPFIVMGYAGPETLRSRLERGPLDRGTALWLFAQVARGVAALHDHSLVHFDLKPANIFLKGDLARVGDYGLAKLVSQSHNSLTFGRGTPYYMAPELLHGRGDHRSDIYALGVLLYECLSGEVPFRGANEWEVLAKHESSPLQFPSVIQAAERALVARCMQKEPAARYPRVADLLDDLQRVTAPPPTPAAAPARAAPRAASALGRGSPRRKRGAALAWTAATLVLVGLLFSAREWPLSEQHRAAIWQPWTRAAAEPTPDAPDAPDTPQARPRPSSAADTWDGRLRQLASDELRQLASELAEADVAPRLRRSLQEAAADLRQQLRRRNAPGLVRTLDHLGSVLEQLLDDLDAQLRRAAGG